MLLIKHSGTDVTHLLGKSSVHTHSPVPQWLKNLREPGRGPVMFSRWSPLLPHDIHRMAS